MKFESFIIIKFINFSDIIISYNFMNQIHSIISSKTILFTDFSVKSVETDEIITSIDQLNDKSTYEVSTKAYPSSLRMSRSFGDFFLKYNETLPIDQQAIIAIPDIISLERTHK